VRETAIRETGVGDKDRETKVGDAERGASGDYGARVQHAWASPGGKQRRRAARTPHALEPAGESCPGCLPSVANMATGKGGVKRAGLKPAPTHRA